MKETKDVLANLQIKPKRQSAVSAKNKNVNPDDAVLSLNVAVDTVCGHCQLGTGIPENGLVLKNISLITCSM